MLASVVVAGNALVLGVGFVVERHFRDAAVHRSLSTASGLGLFLVDAGLWCLVGALYLLLLQSTAHRQPPRQLRRLLLAVPVAFQLALVFAPPLLSIDLLSYVGHGRIAATGGNPYVTPVRVLSGTPFGADLARYGWRPEHGVTPYGPLWTDIEALGLHAVHGVYGALLLLKSVTVLASLGTAALIWWSLGRRGAATRTFATVAFLWNPIVLLEVAREGHNDAVMAFFAVAAVTLLVAGYATASGVALSLAVMTKFVPLLLVPALLVYAWRRSPRLVWRFLAGGVVGVGLGALLYWPFWVGSSTFDGLRDAGHIGENASTAGAIWVVLSHLIGGSAASSVTAVLVDALLVGFVVLVSRRVCRPAELAAACAAIALAYVVIATPIFWSWYVLLALALLALVPGEAALAVLVVLSTCAAVAAPLDDLRHAGVISTNVYFFVATLVGVWVPLVFVVLRRRDLIPLVGRRVGTAGAAPTQRFVNRP